METVLRDVRDAVARGEMTHEEANEWTREAAEYEPDESGTYVLRGWTPDSIIGPHPLRLFTHWLVTFRRLDLHTARGLALALFPSKVREPLAANVRDEADRYWREFTA